MTYQRFITLQPEFADTDVAQVNAELTAAAIEVSLVEWGDLADDGVRYITAHRLALSPFGQAARLVAKDGSTTYFTHYKRLVTIVGSASGFAA